MSNKLKNSFFDERKLYFADGPGSPESGHSRSPAVNDYMKNSVNNLKGPQRDPLAAEVADRLNNAFAPDENDEVEAQPKKVLTAAELNAQNAKPFSSRRDEKRGGGFGEFLGRVKSSLDDSAKKGQVSQGLDKLKDKFRGDKEIKPAKPKKQKEFSPNAVDVNDIRKPKPVRAPQPSHDNAHGHEDKAKIPPIIKGLERKINELSNKKKDYEAQIEKIRNDPNLSIEEQDEYVAELELNIRDIDTELNTKNKYLGRSSNQADIASASKHENQPAQRTPIKPVDVPDAPRAPQHFDQRKARVVEQGQNTQPLPPRIEIPLPPRVNLNENVPQPTNTQTNIDTNVAPPTAPEAPQAPAGTVLELNVFAENQQEVNKRVEVAIRRAFQDEMIEVNSKGFVRRFIQGAFLNVTRGGWEGAGAQRLLNLINGSETKGFAVQTSEKGSIWKAKDAALLKAYAEVMGINPDQLASRNLEEYRMLVVRNAAIEKAKLADVGFMNGNAVKQANGEVTGGYFKENLPPALQAELSQLASEYIQNKNLDKEQAAIAFRGKLYELVDKMPMPSGINIPAESYAKLSKEQIEYILARLDQFNDASERVQLQLSLATLQSTFQGYDIPGGKKFAKDTNAKVSRAGNIALSGFLGVGIPNTLAVATAYGLGLAKDLTITQVTRKAITLGGFAAAGAVGFLPLVAAVTTGALASGGLAYFKTRSGLKKDYEAAKFFARSGDYEGVQNEKIAKEAQYENYKTFLHDLLSDQDLSSSEKAAKLQAYIESNFRGLNFGESENEIDNLVSLIDSIQNPNFPRLDEMKDKMKRYVEDNKANFTGKNRQALMLLMKYSLISGNAQDDAYKAVVSRFKNRLDTNLSDRDSKAKSEINSSSRKAALIAGAFSAGSITGISLANLGIGAAIDAVFGKPSSEISTPTKTAGYKPEQLFKTSNTEALVAGTPQKVDGVGSVTLPEGWKLAKGTDGKFTITTPDNKFTVNSLNQANLPEELKDKYNIEIRENGVQSVPTKDSVGHIYEANKVNSVKFPSDSKFHIGTAEFTQKNSEIWIDRLRVAEVKEAFKSGNPDIQKLMSGNGISQNKLGDLMASADTATQDRVIDTIAKNGGPKGVLNNPDALKRIYEDLNHIEYLAGGAKVEVTVQPGDTLFGIIQKPPYNYNLQNPGSAQDFYNTFIKNTPRFSAQIGDFPKPTPDMSLEQYYQIPEVKTKLDVIYVGDQIVKVEGTGNAQIKVGGWDAYKASLPTNSQYDLERMKVEFNKVNSTHSIFDKDATATFLASEKQANIKSFQDVHGNVAALTDLPGGGSFETNGNTAYTPIYAEGKLVSWTETNLQTGEVSMSPKAQQYYMNGINKVYNGQLEVVPGSIKSINATEPFTLTKDNFNGKAFPERSGLTKVNSLDIQYRQPGGGLTVSIVEKAGSGNGSLNNNGFPNDSSTGTNGGFIPLAGVAPISNLTTQRRTIDRATGASVTTPTPTTPRPVPQPPVPPVINQNVQAPEVEQPKERLTADSLREMNAFYNRAKIVYGNAEPGTKDNPNKLEKIRSEVIELIDLIENPNSTEIEKIRKYAEIMNNPDYVEARDLEGDGRILEEPKGVENNGFESLTPPTVKFPEVKNRETTLLNGTRQVVNGRNQTRKLNTNPKIVDNKTEKLGPEREFNNEKATVQLNRNLEATEENKDIVDRSTERLPRANNENINNFSNQPRTERLNPEIAESTPIVQRSEEDRINSAKVNELLNKRNQTFGFNTVLNVLNDNKDQFSESDLNKINADLQNVTDALIADNETDVRESLAQILLRNPKLIPLFEARLNNNQ